MPLESWTTRAADASADATKVSNQKATSKAAPAAELQNITRTSNRARERRLGREQSNESSSLDRGSTPLGGMASSREAGTSKEAQGQLSRQQRQSTARTTSAREETADMTTGGATNEPPPTLVPERPEGRTASVTSKGAVTSKAAAAQPLSRHPCQQDGQNATGTLASEDTADRTIDEAANGLPPAPAPKRAARRESTTRERSRAASKAGAEGLRTATHTRDVRRCDRSCAWGTATDAASYALCACFLLVSAQARPGLRPHMVSAHARPGLCPHTRTRRKPNETSHGSRRKPEEPSYGSACVMELDNRSYDRPIKFRSIKKGSGNSFPHCTASDETPRYANSTRRRRDAKRYWTRQIAVTRHVTHVWYTLNWNIICQRLPWQSAGSGGDHA